MILLRITGEKGETPPTGKRGGRPILVGLLLVLGVGVVYGLTVRRPAPPQSWLTDLEQARRQSAESKRLLFVEFSAGWCGVCRHMEEQVFPQPTVRQALAHFVKVRIDVDREPHLAVRYGITGVPTMMVMDDQGTVLTQWSGALSQEELLLFLKKASPWEGPR